MGHSLAKPDTQKISLEGSNERLRLRWGAASMQGWPKHMEDRFQAVKEIQQGSGDELFRDCAFFGVFDGHGGEKTATVCQDQLLESILKSAVKTNSTMSMESCLREGFLSLDLSLQESRDTSGEDDNKDQSGSTAVCAIISHDYIHLSNCGDSRGVLTKSGGIVSTETKDHKPTVDEERQRIMAAEGVVLNGRVNGMLAVSRSIGDFDFKITGVEPEKQLVSPVPDVTTITRGKEEEELLILACDGVFDVMKSQDLVDYVRYLLRCTRSGSLKEICENVVDTCLYKGSRDNITIIIVAFDSVAPKFDEEAEAQDKELNRRLEEAVEAEMRKNVASISAGGENLIGDDPLSYLMVTLAQEDISGLPPGGGLPSKLPVIENSYKQKGKEEADQGIFAPASPSTDVVVQSEDESAPISLADANANNQSTLETKALQEQAASSDDSFMKQKVKAAIAVKRLAQQAAANDNQESKVEQSLQTGFTEDVSSD